MVPFSYLINSPTELDDWTFQPNNDTFEMLENNSAFADKMNLTTRKTFEVLFGSEKIGEELFNRINNNNRLVENPGY